MTEQTQAEAPVDTTTTTETTETTKDLSIGEELGANLEIQEKGEDSPDLSTAARTLAAARKGKAPIDKVDPAVIAESEKVGKENADKAKRAAELAAMPPEDRAKAEAEDKAKAEAPATEAPAHWPAADREMFAKQPPEVKTWLLGRHKAMEADYTKKTQEVAPMRRLKETLDEVFAPFREEMQLNGVDEAMAIRQLVAAHAMLQRDPAGGIKRLAGQYGIDLKGVIEGAAAADPAGESPTVKALRTQVETLTGQITKLTGAQGQQQLDARLNEVTQFADEKDAQGNLKRPYFDEVAKDVAIRIRVAREEGKPISLQDAYESAVYANPISRAKVLQAQDAERRSKEEAERKARADAAKKAGFNITGEGAATQVAAQTGSIREDLEAAFADFEGRV